MKNIKLAIIDCIGLNYDGSTLTKKGIGGSESSIISIARELAKIGLSVTIFNDCVSDETTPGLYDGVQYHPIRTLAQVDFNFDIVISQRTVIPFTPENLYDQVRQPAPRDFDPTIFKQLQRPHQLKILWQQDTFIWGDHILENLILSKHIDEIFCLSDWHIAYTSNCAHGDKRNFEVLKNYIWHTRNAINRWIDWVDVKHKDPNLFVYNASITKGMVPLVEKIWPRIKAYLPDAKLKIIGGYYKFRDEIVSDAANKVMALQDSVKHDLSIQFTGIIPQPKIAEIMSTASYNLFPGAYPETSGISSIESVNYNTPIIGTRFGAMEESGTEAAGYYMDYSIEPNGLFPWINQDAQVDKFVNLVLQVVKNPYLHQQKQYACNLVKDVSTWDTVALQWKQHFYAKLGLELSQQEQSRVEWINYRVHKVFGRRFSNTEEIKVNNPVDKITMLPNKLVKIAIIDIVGMAYDGDSLKRGGLGGSESAVILNSQELAKIGFDVTVFNACDEGDNKPGVYNGVSYRPLSDIAKTTQPYDVLISSRVVTPFITEPWYGYPQTTNRKIDYSAFEKLRSSAKLRALWMHDTFCWGDDILEDLVVAGAIDELWTLSDFHAMYIMNCSHPRMRNYEVLRKRMWTTRNGIVKYFDKVDIDSKDPNLFIFNANMSKGLDPLLNLVWPGVKANLPNARLTVIGGFYKLGAAFAHDNEESEFNKIAGPHFNDPTIEFTGIISQREVAKLSAKASFFIYPAALPETYGISTMEALYANTPLLTCRFGALEETAGPHSYYIDYASVPNGLFPKINAHEQANKFVKMVVDAVNDRNSHRQRMESLDEIKDIAGWDVVSLEWKEHIYAKLGLYLSKEESQQVSYTKSKYQKIFNRRFSTAESWLAPKITAERKILVVSPFYNAQDYIKKCILSVASQNYTDYEHWMINDASTDNSAAIVYDTINQLPKNIQDRFKLINNNVNVGAVANQMYFINHYNADPMNTIVMFLDGDDSLTNSSDIFTYYNQLHNDYDFTYGSSWSQADSIPLVGQPYPPDIKTNKQYRSHRFNWNMPYTHLRTFKIGLAYGLPDDLFKDDNGNWFRAGGDTATFYNILERADPRRVHAVADIVYNYNDLNPINDYKVNAHQQNETVNHVIEQRDVRVPIQESKITVTHRDVSVPVQESKIKLEHKTPKRILIAIPTNRNIEAETFKSIYDLKIPDGYEVEFQYFWGYSRSQIKNLICEWAKQYDYTIFMRKKGKVSPNLIYDIISHDTDIVLIDDSLVFCAKKNVFVNLQYPHFESEDSEKEEIESFITKAIIIGATVKHLKNYFVR